MMLFSDFIYLNALSKAFWVAASFFHQKFCTSSVPGAIPLFLLLTSFFSFFVSLSNSFITKTFLPSNLFTSSLPNSTPKFDKFLNLRHFYFSGLVSFQCFEKAFLVALELVLLSFSLFDTFFQFNFLVSQLINPLLFCDSQIIEG